MARGQEYTSSDYLHAETPGRSEQGATQQAKQGSGQAMEQAQAKMGQALDKVEEKATSQAETQKVRAAEMVSQAAQAIHQTGDQLRQQDQQSVARFADMAAGRLDNLSGYLRQKDVQEMIDDVQDMARRQPMLFLGGAFAAGLLAARFLKSSGRQGSRYGAQPSYNPPAYRTGAYENAMVSEEPSYNPGRRTGSGIGSEDS